MTILLAASRGCSRNARTSHSCRRRLVERRLVEQQSRRLGVSGSLGFVHSLLTKRRAVDFCRLRSSLCWVP
jgi:hypothetical protein